jgi:5-methylthioadenosine/S-adenosylhomocysteine deaminase
MPAVLADLSIEARWIVPMTMPGRILEDHTLVVRDGRILDILPSAAAPQRYAATVLLRRPAHLLMPGLVNASTYAATSLFRAVDSDGTALEQRFLGTDFVRDGVLAAIAEMLRSGITCFADRYYFPEVTARIAAEQGMRALIGMPVAETKSSWAGSSADYLTKALDLRDEYRGHPLISTAFAPHAPNTLSDATFARIATLADELDAGIMIDLHESADGIAVCADRHGKRPIERLWDLGLLTPALNAVHMAHATPGDIELARRTGVSITLCPLSDLKAQGALPPAPSFAAAGIPLSVGSGKPGRHQNQDVWGEMKMLAAMSCAGSPSIAAWSALAAATRGGGAALGMEDVGSLDLGMWADLCCLDLSGPAVRPLGDPVTQLVFCGGRDLVSDVWVAGRQLLSDGMMTRLDWPGVAARADAWGRRLNTGD